MENIDLALVVLKPDCIKLGLEKKIVTLLTERGLNLLHIAEIQFTEESIRKLYQKYEDAWFFPHILEYLQEDKSILTVWEGENCNEICQELKGNSYRKTGIRGEWASCEIVSENGETSLLKNVMHVTDAEDFDKEYEILSNIIIEEE